MASSQQVQSLCGSAMEIPMIGSLPVKLAVIEATEILVLQLHKSTEDTLSYNVPSVKVKIKTIGVNTGGGQAWFFVRVKCSDAGITEPNLKWVISRYGEAMMKIVRNMQQIFSGEFMWVERLEKGTRTHMWFKVEGTSAEITRKQEKQAECPQNINQLAREISICWKMVQSKEHMISECEGICDYLHSLKLFSPHYNIQFYLNVWGVVSSSRFDWKSLRAHLGQRKMAVDIQHFVSPANIPVDVQKIYPKTGQNYMLSSVKFGSFEENLKLSSVAAIVPQPLDITEIGTRELNTKCHKLKVIFYGPGNIPLFGPHLRMSGICPTTVIRVEEYGWALDGAIVETEDPEMVNFDWCYKLKPSDDDWHLESCLDWEDESNDEHSRVRYTVLLVIFLDRAKPNESTSLSANLYLLDGIRQHFAQILCKHRTKVRKAASSSLDKMLQNFTKADQKLALLNKAIATITSSVVSVVEQSHNHNLQGECLQALNIHQPGALGDTLKKNLWSIATERYNINQQGKNTSKAKPKKRPSEKSKTLSGKKKPDCFDELASICPSNCEVSVKLNNQKGDKLPCFSSPKVSTIPEETKVSPFTDLIEVANQEEQAHLANKHFKQTDASGDDQIKDLLNSISNDENHLYNQSELIDITQDTDDWDLDIFSGNLLDENDIEDPFFKEFTKPIPCENVPSSSAGALNGIDMNCERRPGATSSYVPRNETSRDIWQTHERTDCDPVLSQGFPSYSGNRCLEDWLQNFSNFDE